MARPASAAVAHVTIVSSGAARWLLPAGMPTRLAYPGLLVLFGVIVARVAGLGPLGILVAGTAINVVLFVL